MKTPVTSKYDFTMRYKLGEFGNCSPSWSVDQYLDQAHAPDAYKGLIHLRNLKEAGGKTIYNVQADDIHRVIENRDWCYVLGMAPHAKHGTIQGNVMLSEKGLVLEWVPASIPMREAIAKYGFHTLIGIKAVMLLKYYMNQMSWDWLQSLLEDYPDHVIEFSCFDTYWGTLTGYNTCFWEVRKY